MSCSYLFQIKNIGTSSRNSEVIHAGIYYPKSSQKAKLCVKGKHMLYEYCTSRNIPFEKKGKLIVATNESQRKIELPKLFESARFNGVNDLCLVSNEDVIHQFGESEIVCHGALYSPSTGVVDSHSLMVSLLADAENSGSATLALNTNVDQVKVKNGKLIVTTKDMELSCDALVNCAGLHAGDISQMVFDSIDENDWNPKNKCKEISSTRQYFAKGNYYRLQGQKSPFHHLIYPVPEKGGLGVHATIDLGGNTRFGPDVEWISEDIVNADEIDMNVNPERSKVFYDEVRKYWPGLKDDSLVPDYCGIRPKLGHPSNVDGPSIKADFHIQGEKHHGISGFVNLVGIESPGLTSSLAIAESVRQMLEKHHTCRP